VSHTEYRTNDLTFDLPGEGWIDQSFNAIVTRDSALSCFVGRDSIKDHQTAIEELVAVVTKGSTEMTVEGRRACVLGPLEGQEARVIALEEGVWLYYRIASTHYYDKSLTLAFYGPEGRRAEVDDQMDRTQREIRFRRR
jgi:hypothetical protein